MSGEKKDVSNENSLTSGHFLSCASWYAPGPSPTQFRDASGYVRALLSPHPPLRHHSDSQRDILESQRFSEVP